MNYAVITINKETKRIIEARLYDAPKEGEIGVGHLPSGNITDYLYENGEYVYSPNKDIGEERFKQIKSQKLSDMSMACEQTIYHGIDVDLSDGSHHFSLTGNDQTNIDGVFNAIVLGATKYPYHADGEPCTMFSANDIVTLYVATKTFVTKQTTYNNMLRQWIKRETDVCVVDSIKYGTDLPSDLNAEMTSILEAANQEIQTLVSKLETI